MKRIMKNIQYAFQWHFHGTHKLAFALCLVMNISTIYSQDFFLNEISNEQYMVIHKHSVSPILLNVNEVDSITFLTTNPNLDSYSLPARWYVEQMPMFSLHDDDAIDIYIPSSKVTSAWMMGGYATLTYPLLQSLNLKGCISMEGQRVGFTDNIPCLNYNGQVIKHLQDHHGWEVMSHSMTARYVSAVYAVDDINGSLANEILENARYAGVNSMLTTCVVDTIAGVNYIPNATCTAWQTLPFEYIRPYVMDYKTNHVIAYNRTYPVEYQWGRFMELSTKFGIDIHSGVMPATTGSHAIYPLIQPFLPNLFDQGTAPFCNQPPLPSYVMRKSMEPSGGEQNPDNHYDSKTLNEWKALIDEAVRKKAWLVFYMHGYRPCWLNKIDDELVSRGGTYPDEWVHPILPEDDIMKAIDTPPARLGISSWSEWYPCPGTRLSMLYELLKYAISKGLLNVTSKEGFECMGNIYAVGYYNKNGQAGQNVYNIEGTKNNYPHHVLGIDGSEDYKR